MPAWPKISGLEPFFHVFIENIEERYTAVLVFSELAEIEFSSWRDSS